MYLVLDIAVNKCMHNVYPYVSQKPSLSNLKTLKLKYYFKVIHPPPKKKPKQKPKKPVKEPLEIEVTLL